MTVQEKQKIINKLNTRIRRTLNWHTKNGIPTDFFEDTLQAARHTEGIEFSNPYRISTSKKILENVSDLSIKTLEETILTPSQLISKAEDYIKANMEEDIDLSNKSDKEVAAMAGAIIKVYADYNDALSDYYNLTDKLDVDAIVNEEIKQTIYGMLMQIDIAIHHKGVYALPVEKVEQNKKLIGELAGKIEAVKKGM